MACKNRCVICIGREYCPKEYCEQLTEQDARNPALIKQFNRVGVREFANISSAEVYPHLLKKFSRTNVRLITRLPGGEFRDAKQLPCDVFEAADTAGETAVKRHHDRVNNWMYRTFKCPIEPEREPRINRAYHQHFIVIGTLIKAVYPFTWYLDVANDNPALDDFRDTA